MSSRRQEDGRQRRASIDPYHLRLMADLDGEVAVLDSDGVIVAVNDEWEQFGRDNGQSPGYDAVGHNYLDVCAAAADHGCAVARVARDGIRGVLVGSRDAFAMGYPCDARTRPRWFMMTVMGFPGMLGGAIVSHVDTSRLLGR